ncbi:MAG TPA: TIGR00341 family protein [Gammaproteobacteria bacterium]|jgi:uncharacterized hydrophobic protein (TIGR00341 family)|nr:TIGR00341 family protein [Gammaproteobacteria bacterium]
MRLIEIITDAGHADTLSSIAEQHEIIDSWRVVAGEDGRVVFHMLVSDASRQPVIDALQNLLGASEKTRIIIQPVDAVLPRPGAPVEVGRKLTSTGSQTREELYDKIARGAQLDSTFLLLVCLSTVVASVGLLEANVAVIVGAMVIAPLLGPNIALAFATSLGDRVLIWQAIKTNLTGMLVTLVMSVVTGRIWQGSLDNAEIMLRTDVGLAGVVLALASGAAAVLSLITGLSSALVGVMVAVALLPPAATLGMMLGSGQFSAAGGAALLLAVNVVCINLSAKLMFLLKGVRPRTWVEKNQARQSAAIYTTVWIVVLALLIITIMLRHRVLG